MMAAHRGSHVATLVAAICLCLALVLCSCHAQANDNALFSAFYDSVIEMVAPSSGDPSSAGPRQVILFEMPGLGINRNEWDQTVWAANNFQERQPDAVAAQFVDRLPYYFGPTFVDSGSQISTFWGNFLQQYVIPTFENPTQAARANAARAALANGNLTAVFESRLGDYDDAVAQYENKRSDCLARSSPAICSQRMVSWNELLKRKWFSLEVARRDVASAEALIIALQVQDLKNLFADALEQYGSNERIDVGAAGFGQEYLLTYMIPSNFWRWWPQNVGVFDYMVSGIKPLTFNFTQPGAAVSSPPTHGTLQFSPLTGTAVYVASGSFTGIETIGFSYLTPLNATLSQNIQINVIGSDALIADTSFVTVSTYSSSTTTSASTSSSYQKTFSTSNTNSNSYSYSWWWWRSSGWSSSTTNSVTSAYTTASAFSSSSTSTNITFDLARVAIIRPWLDVSLLSYSPVAVRSVLKGAWSDGTVSPALNTNFRFKLLPVAFLVARNVRIASSQWGTKSATASSVSSLASNTVGSSVQVSIGPWFIGASISSTTTNTRDYKEFSSFTADTADTTAGGTLSIRGPQVIGWVCTPVPAFPTASEDEVTAFEQAQLQKFYKQLAANKGVTLAALGPQ